MSEDATTLSREKGNPGGTVTSTSRSPGWNVYADRLPVKRSGQIFFAHHLVVPLLVALLTGDESKVAWSAFSCPLASCQREKEGKHSWQEANATKIYRAGSKAFRPTRRSSRLTSRRSGQCPSRTRGSGEIWGLGGSRAADAAFYQCVTERSHIVQNMQNPLAKSFYIQF